MRKARSAFYKALAATEGRQGYRDILKGGVMKKYRKKPVVVEATQITKECFDLEHPNDLHVPGVIYNPLSRCVEIKTLEGTMIGWIGDWIIKGVNGELYPCKPDIFEKTYECCDNVQ